MGLGGGHISHIEVKISKVKQNEDELQTILENFIV